MFAKWNIRRYRGQPGTLDLWIGGFHIMWARDVYGQRFFAIAFGDNPRRGFRIPR
jgi:hypothetical protein